MADGLIIPPAERIVIMTQAKASDVCIAANKALIAAAETVVETCDLPRWAALISLQPSLAAAFCPIAIQLDRQPQMRAFVRASAEMAAADLRDGWSFFNAAKEADRIHRALMAGESVQ